MSLLLTRAIICLRMIIIIVVNTINRSDIHFLLPVALSGSRSTRKMGIPNERWDKRADLLCQIVDTKLLLIYPDDLVKLVEVCDVKISGRALGLSAYDQQLKLK